MNQPRCACKPAALVHMALRGDDNLPACPTHRPDLGATAPAIALNDDSALAARLGMPLNKEN